MNEFMLWLWEGLTRDLIEQGVDTGVLLDRIYETEYGINRYSNTKDIEDEHETNGS